jgi:hypothetical protein
MDVDILFVVNYLAVFLAALAGTVIGILWYSPLVFGNSWARLVGISEKEIELKGKGEMVLLYFINFIATLVIALVLSIFIRVSGNYGDFISGMLVGIILWFGFVATVEAGKVLWESKPFGLYLINALYYLTSFAVMGGIIGLMYEI